MSKKFVRMVYVGRGGVFVIPWEAYWDKVIIEKNIFKKMFMLCWGGNLRGGLWGKVGRGRVSGSLSVGMVDVWVSFISMLGVSGEPFCVGSGVRMVDEACGDNEI